MHLFLFYDCCLLFYEKTEYEIINLGTIALILEAARDGCLVVTILIDMDTVLEAVRANNPHPLLCVFAPDSSLVLKQLIK